MTENRIRSLRKLKRLTLDELAARVNLSKPYLSRIEKGERRLSIEVAERVATALDVSTSELLGYDQATGFSEDAVPYEADEGDPLAGLAARRNHALFVASSDVLDEAGIRAGDILTIDMSEDAVADVPALACVIVQIYDRDDLTSAKTLMRQFVPPNKLITNSSRQNLLPINMDIVDAHIKGVVVARHSDLRPGRRG